MAVVRFLGYIVVILLIPFLILPLAVLWLLGYIIIGTIQLWWKANRDPRYDKYWWVN